jgi:hypothetical protein
LCGASVHIYRSDRSPSVFENPIGNYPSRTFPTEEFEIWKHRKQCPLSALRTLATFIFGMCHRRQTTNTTPSAVDARNLVSMLYSSKPITRCSDWRKSTIVLTCRFNLWLLPAPLTPFPFRDGGCLPIRILHALAKHQPPSEGLVVVKRNTSHPAILWKS